MLSSCVIIPIPPTNALVYGMRDNVEDRVPPFIVPGVTTREDVLMQLGESDSYSLYEAQLSYRSGVHRGGVVVIIAAGGSGAGYEYGRELHRILIVDFDIAGLVKSARLQMESCSAHMGGGTRALEARSCVPVELPATPEDAPKAGGSELER
jgi:hypothetical protein